MNKVNSFVQKIEKNFDKSFDDCIKFEGASKTGGYRVV